MDTIRLSSVTMIVSSSSNSESIAIFGEDEGEDEVLYEDEEDVEVIVDEDEVAVMSEESQSSTPKTSIGSLFDCSRNCWYILGLSRFDV